MEAHKAPKCGLGNSAGEPYNVGMAENGLINAMAGLGRADHIGGIGAFSAADGETVKAEFFVKQVLSQLGHRHAEGLPTAKGVHQTGLTPT
jgi:hypothetical protein